jgi:hypothetical protein
MGYGLASFDQPSLRNFSIVVVVMPDAFTEQAVQKRAAFLEPSELRVFFCYFQVLNSECFFKLFHSALLGLTQCCWNLLSLRNRRQI